jgi:hypothetical protein
MTAESRRPSASCFNERSNTRSDLLPSVIGQMVAARGADESTARFSHPCFTFPCLSDAVLSAASRLSLSTWDNAVICGW